MANFKQIFDLVGIIDDGKRSYIINEEKEVKREEFEYSQLMHQLVFGEKGFVETLGPTWHLVNDPRFLVIESRFVTDRRAIFGGDASIGKQFIYDDGTFTSSVTDLEQYAEILGEGRNFHNVLTHPDKDCPVRRWLERIYDGFTSIKPHAAMRCTCEGKATSPTEFKIALDEDVWALIKQECPNRAFDKKGTPTVYGKLMFDLIRLDLMGLIADYAETPLIDSYIYLKDNGVVVSAEEVAAIDPKGLDHQRVLQEIDILEQALTHRASLRVTAVKVLKDLKVEEMLQKIKEPTGEQLMLTDVERDELLRIVYTSEWPNEKTKLVIDIISYLSYLKNFTRETRLAQQAEIGRAKSQHTIQGLMNGTIRPINHYTEPTVEIPKDMAESEVMQYAAMMDSLTKNPLKAELFQVYVSAESEGEQGVLDILTPIFDPNYEVDEATYFNLLRAVTRRARSLRVMDMEEVLPRGTADTPLFVPKDIRELEGEFHGKDSLKDDE